MNKLNASQPTLKRLFNHIEISTTLKYGDTPCWIWTGSQSEFEYGKAFFNKRKYPAHRLFYCLFVENISDDMVIDHLCRNTLCCNPVHLEAVTQQENVLRGVGHGAINAQKTHCPQGHLLADDNLCNTEKSYNRRACKICKVTRARKYRQPSHTRILPQKQEIDIHEFQQLQQTDRLTTSRYLLARIFSKITISTEHFLNDDACWEWQGCVPKSGYGQVFFIHPLNTRNPNTYLAHKMMYELFVGAVPDGYKIGHLCALRSCVNPAHLLCAPPAVLNHRADNIASRNAQKTHCPKGHPLSGDNLV